ncbi:hypothetical protein J2X65_002771 [Ancylobacter sp. 3268]|nr:hypothetical protein [Ancylobacter sp. 3268]
MREHLNFTLPAELIARINELAERRKIPRSAIVEAAIASFCPPMPPTCARPPYPAPRPALSSERTHRARSASHHRYARAVRPLLVDDHPPLPGDAQAAAQIKGRERYEGFIETLGKRLQKGQNFLTEIPDDVGDTVAIGDEPA